MTTTDHIKALLAEILQLGDRVEGFTADTGLLGSIAEFDSMAVASLVAGLEDRFGIVIDDEDLSEEVFMTIGSLADMVDGKLEAA